MKLSIIIPAYNEAATIDRILTKVSRQPLPGMTREIIVVDDGSTDGTTAKIKKWQRRGKILALFQKNNLGKGAAVHQGLKKATGDYVLIQDADLEYDPADIPQLWRPVQEQGAGVVYGSRFTGPRKNMFFWHMMGNQLLTFMINILFDTTLSDMEVGYKLFQKDLLLSLNLREKRFGFEPEVTAKILKKGIRIFEVPINYVGREYAEGKKITWQDGIKALLEIIKYRFVD